jgi:DNA-directed RNA polymerase specialized sigma24 family protein
LTSEDFDKLLGILDADRECAGEKYEDFRRKLARYFMWNDCFPAEDLTDTVFDRVALRLRNCQVRDIGGFIFGVARNVKREFHKRPPTVSIEELPVCGQLQSEHLELRIIDDAEKCRRRACLRQCVMGLRVKDRELFLEYEYYGQRTLEIDMMAQRLNLTIGALRTKAHRIKRRVEACVLECFHHPRKPGIKPEDEGA